jgi:hypothetical protein
VGVAVFYQFSRKGGVLGQAASDRSQSLHTRTTVAWKTCISLHILQAASHSSLHSVMSTSYDEELNAFHPHGTLSEIFEYSYRNLSNVPTFVNSSEFVNFFILCIRQFFNFNLLFLLNLLQLFLGIFWHTWDVELPSPSVVSFVFSVFNTTRHTCPCTIWRKHVSSNGSGWEQHGRQPQRWLRKEINLKAGFPPPFFPLRCVECRY